MRIKYRFPAGAFGRVPQFAHKAISKYLSGKEILLFFYGICQASNYDLTMPVTMKHTNMTESEVKDCFNSLLQKGFITLCDGGIEVEWDHIKMLSEDNAQIATEDVGLIYNEDYDNNIPPDCDMTALWGDGE